MRLNFPKTKRGDTIIEVTFAITIFALVSVLTVSLMNAGLATAQGSLELSTTRAEMNAQAEAIRFIHNSFLSERELVTDKQQYRDLWVALTQDTGAVNVVNSPENLPALAVNNCSEVYDSSKDSSILGSKLTAFVLNTRAIDPYDETMFPAGSNSKLTTSELREIVVSTKNSPQKFVETQLYPRVIFTRNSSTGSDADVNAANSDTELEETSTYRYVARAEGLWVISVKDSTTSNHKIPEFYDFHIRACWYAPGKNNPTTIGTIIRLYNPELVEGVQ